MRAGELGVDAKQQKHWLGWAQTQMDMAVRVGSGYVLSCRRENFL